MKLPKTTEFFSEAAKKALSKCKIINNNDGTVNIIGSLRVNFPFEFLPQIKQITGDFDCNNNQDLTTLKGAPRVVGNNFNCRLCTSIKTLEGSPNYVGGNFICNFCTALETLKGAPTQVAGSFICNYCANLKTIKNTPNYIGGDFLCDHCPSLNKINNTQVVIIGEPKLNDCNKLSKQKIENFLKGQKENKKRYALEIKKTNQGENTWCFR